MSNISPRDKTQRAYHEDANPGPEVTSVQSNKKNARDGVSPPPPANALIAPAKRVQIKNKK